MTWETREHMIQRLSESEPYRPSLRTLEAIKNDHGILCEDNGYRCCEAGICPPGCACEQDIGEE
jgi:hypothetical protein